MRHVRFQGSADCLFYLVDFPRRTPNTTNQPTFDTNAQTTTNTEGCYKDGQDSPKVEKTKRANRFSSQIRISSIFGVVTFIFRFPTFTRNTSQSHYQNLIVTLSEFANSDRYLFRNSNTYLIVAKQIQTSRAIWAGAELADGAI